MKMDFTDGNFTEIKFEAESINEARLLRKVYMKLINANEVKKPKIIEQMLME